MMTQIRRAERSDTTVVEAIVRDAYLPYVARIGQKPGPMLDDYAALIAGGHVHVATIEGWVRGVVVLIVQGDAMLLDNIAVDPAAQGKGIGNALLVFAEHSASRAGFGKIRLYTHELMVENIALYGRIGYRETCRVEEKGFRRVYMEKPLAKPTEGS